MISIRTSLIGSSALNEKVLLEESVLDEQIFEIGAFKNAGGFTIIDRRFGGKLREIITELNEYLYEDGGSIA